MENNVNANDDVLMMIYQRNAFYKKKYHTALAVYFLSLVMIVILVGMLIFLHRHPPHPLYFVTDDVSRIIQEVPLQSPNMTTQQVSDWAVNAVETAYSYDFVNFRGQLQRAQRYFTDYGWRSYMKGLTASNNLLSLDKYKYVQIAKVVDKPRLVIEGILGGAYAWKFEMPMLVTYMQPPYDEKSKFQNPLLVTVVVQRQKILESYQGLGIVQMIGDLVITPSATQTLSPTAS